MIEISLEVLTIASFALVFIRRRSKEQLRRSEYYSTLMRNENPPHGQFEDPTTPTKAYAQLEGKAEYHVDQKILRG
jgi:hypothetical protein